MATPYTFARGSTIAVALQIITGDPTGVSSIKAAIRPSLSRITSGGSSGILPSAQALVKLVAASGSASAYWLVIINAADSYYLPSGDYSIDAEIVAGGLTVTTSPAPISIFEPDTVPTAPTSSGFGAPWTGSGTVVITELDLQWANAMDVTDFIFPALSLTIDPNIAV